MTKRGILVIVSNELSEADLREIVKALSAPAPAPTGAERTKARIVKAATGLFQKHGYRRVSVDEVARAAHVAKGSVYVHFEDKAQLLAAAIAEEKRTIAVHFADLFDGKLKPKARLRAYLQRALEMVPQAPLIARLMGGDQELNAFLEDLGPELRAQLAELQTAAFLAMLKGVGRFDQLSRAERRDRARALLAMINGLVTTAVQLQANPGLFEFPPGRFAELLASIVIDGVGG